MQIVIDIPDEDYQIALTKLMLEFKGCSITTLPKGHGRLIDADEALNAMDSWDKFGYFNNRMFPLNKDTETEFIAYVHYVDMVEAIYNAPTIIEADKDKQFIEMQKLTIDECLKNELREYKGEEE